MITPLEQHHSLSALFNLDIDLRIKRDDLFPMSGGGIKARKMQYIINDILEKRCNVIVTNGGPQSNHARAAALIAAEKGIKCHLVIVLESNRCYSFSGNILLMALAGAKIEFCRKDQLADHMDQAIEYYKKHGFNPAYIWGGGHNYIGTVAFVEAAEEAQKQCGEWIPDYLIIASGTGSTQAGLAIGYFDYKTKVIGISVARDAIRGAKIIKDCINDYYANKGQSSKRINVDFRDDWTCGGYEKTKPELISIIKRAGKTGIILDPTYSGKGFYGLVDLVQKRIIKSGSKVLFWHSGGLLNLMASDLAKGHISI